MELQWHDIVGGAGVATLLTTYLLLQINYISAKSLRYSVLNGLGAAMILVTLSFDFNLSAFVIESCWLVISFIGAMVSIFEMRKATNHK